MRSADWPADRTLNFSSKCGGGRWRRNLDPARRCQTIGRRAHGAADRRTRSLSVPQYGSAAFYRLSASATVAFILSPRRSFARILPSGPMRNIAGIAVASKAAAMGESGPMTAWHQGIFSDLTRVLRSARLSSRLSDTIANRGSAANASWTALRFGISATQGRTTSPRSR